MAKTKLSKFVGKLIVPAPTKPFIARDHFVINTASNAPVQIAYLGDNFEAWFLDKTEALKRRRTAICYRELEEVLRDASIITGLGGEKKAETTLYEMFNLLEFQGHGENGPLLTGGCANVFYIRDNNGVLCAMGATQCGNCWNINAYLVTDRRRWWRDGSRVFSRE